MLAGRNNQAYTYLNLDYGSMGREKARDPVASSKWKVQVAQKCGCLEDSDCFGFSGNVSAGPQERTARCFILLYCRSETYCNIHQLKELGPADVQF